MLLRWRNDAETRANSKTAEMVSAEDHARWMEFNVKQGYPTHIVMIAETEADGSIGVVRFDVANKDVMTYRVSITIAPNSRNQGLALLVLSQACRIMQEYTLLAEIKCDNQASLKTFERCGFAMTGKTDNLETFRREPLA
jgi:L-amino acid N-acyltransferase YncA